MRNIYNTVILFALFFATVACSNEDEPDLGSASSDYISFSISGLSSSINEDQVNWEDRVDELRMILFYSQSGEVAYNEKLYFPNGFAAPTKGVRLRSGTYDFYFIANETVYPDDFVDALVKVDHRSDLMSAAFTNIKYDASFLPGESSPKGRFLMSAIYEGVEVTAGGTENAPLLFDMPATGKVELIRSLAKVEVVFRKKVSGSTLPESSITSVFLDQVASTFSVPPYDNYFEGEVERTPFASLDGLNFESDSIGSVVFYVPEFLLAEGEGGYTRLSINNQAFPIETDAEKRGITLQRRSTPELSDNSVIRNYHYKINAYVNVGGEVEIRVYVKPWEKDSYSYIFEGDKEIIIPPVLSTDSSIIIPTDCGKIELLSYNEKLTQGLQGAYNDVVNYWDPSVGGPVIYRGESPYYCEKKYGKGWRLIDSCELMSFLSILDAAYNVWMCNTWLTNAYNNNNPDNPLPFYSVPFRKAAQGLLEKLTGVDLSACKYMEDNNWQDELVNIKLDIIDNYFTPGDIMVKEDDFPNGWPYPSTPGTNAGESWYYNEAVIQARAFWYDAGYVSLADRGNWYQVLYGNFVRYDFSSTVSRCVREVR